MIVPNPTKVEWGNLWDVGERRASITLCQPVFVGQDGLYFWALGTGLFNGECGRTDYAEALRICENWVSKVTP